MTSRVEKSLLWNISALKGIRFEGKQEEQDSGTDYVLATSGYLHLKLRQNRANPIYRCKIFAKAHPRAKVSQTNTHRLKAARKISEWAGCLLLLVHWQLIRSKTEPSPAFFRCRIFLWWFTWANLQQLIMPHSEIILQLIPSSALMY